MLRRNFVVIGCSVLSAAILIVNARAEDKPLKAVCELMATSGSKVSGKIEFTQKGDSVEIKGEIKGLTPGKHGFHVHEGSECGDDGMKAGGHFNPDKAKHGGPHDSERHVGDLGNIEADSNGVAKINLTDKLVKLEGKSSVIGHCLVVHAKADDLKSQPAGDAGARIGCGQIKAVK